MKLLPYIRKAKDIFLIDTNGNKYYDLSTNTNILGHSYKKLTTIIKNTLSACWNCRENSIYHRRLISLYEKIFGSDYHVRSCFSLIEFFSRLLNVSGHCLHIEGERLTHWFNKNLPGSVCDNTDKKITVIDMTELYLKAKGNNEVLKELIDTYSSNDATVTIHNYYWYPEPNIASSDADIVILPEFYSGNFSYVGILVNKRLLTGTDYTSDIYRIPSLYIASSLKMHYLLQKPIKPHIPHLKRDGFEQANRVFSPTDLTTGNHEQMVAYLREKHILITSEPPYYNYLPLTLEAHQSRHLREVFNA